MSNFVEIAKITTPHGIKGEVKIFTFSKDTNLTLYKNYFLDGQKIEISFRGFKKQNAIAKIENYNDRNLAESLRNKVLMVKREELPELDDDFYYITDLIGSIVKNDQGEIIGSVINVHDFDAGDIIEIEFTANKKREQFPFLEAIFPELDLDNNQITFIPPEII